ncbi:MAG: hypothetical protein N2169_05700 [bacterium]|nr:hypothetical protein [bacterium]
MSSWQRFSFIEQMANIAVEFHRMIRWKNNPHQFEALFYRVIDLIVLTIEDPKNKNTHRIKELCRLKSIIIDGYLGGKEFKTNLEDLTKYFDSFLEYYYNTKKFKK